MTRRAWWIVGFLGVTALAAGAELVAAFDSSPDTVPWTELLTDLPWWVTMPAALILAVWLPLHLAYWYRRRAAARRADSNRRPDGGDTAAVPVGPGTAPGTPQQPRLSSVGKGYDMKPYKAIVAAVGAGATALLGIVAPHTLVWNVATVVAAVATAYGVWQVDNGQPPRG